MAGGLSSVLSVLGMGFIALNMLGGVVSGLWLAFLGKWGAIGLGLAGIFISHIVISIALMPSFDLGAGGAAAANRGSRWGMLFFGLLSNVYIAAIFTVWCMGILLVFVSMADNRSLIPMLIWSYGVALGPWQFLASKDAQAGTGGGSAQTTFFGQAAFVVSVVAGLITRASFVTMAVVFGGIMLVNVALQMILMAAMSKTLLEQPSDGQLDLTGW